MNLLLSGTEINNCIIKTDRSYTYNMGSIMKQAHRSFRLLRVFNKDLSFGDVLKAVWGKVRSLVKQYISVLNGINEDCQKAIIGDFKTSTNQFGVKYKLVN